MAERSREDDTRAELMFAELTSHGDGAPTAEQKAELARWFRSDPERSSWLDQKLFVELDRRAKGLYEARDQQRELRKLVESLVAPPWHTAVLVHVTETEVGARALVMHGTTSRVVPVSVELDPDELAVGDEVYLDKELNVIVGKSPSGAPQCGETAVFERPAGGGRAVIRYRDEELVVGLAAALRIEDLRPGDLVRWERSSWLVFERLERSMGTHLFLEEMPEVTFDQIGGLDHETAEIRRCILRHLRHGETARRYQLRRKRAILLVGPPGVGKTMTARAFCNWLGKLSPSGRARFMNIKPSGLHSAYFSESERNYREAFRVAREAAKEEPDIPVVMFFDEVDAIGAMRGVSHMRIDDKVLNAFMIELDGLEDRGNVLVMAATNRPDALDPAFMRPERFGDSIIEIPRPNRAAAREIFAKHLPEDIPYREVERGLDGPDARAHIIESLVSQMYAPNGDGELTTLVFRDGTRRVLGSRDLISGADIAKIARNAIERACDREIETGEGGVRLDDALTAAAEQRETVARVLTPANARRYLSGLPDDLDVVRVEPVSRRVSRPHAYLNVA